MNITLTRTQWTKLQAIVRAGKRSEVALGLPIDLDNGDQRIIIEQGEVRIQLPD